MGGRGNRRSRTVPDTRQPPAADAPVPKGRRTRPRDGRAAATQALRIPGADARPQATRVGGVRRVWQNACRRNSSGRGFAFRFFRLRLAATPCGSATVAVIGSDWLLSSNEILPMLGTPCAGRPRPASFVSGSWTEAGVDARCRTGWSPAHGFCPVLRKLSGIGHSCPFVSIRGQRLRGGRPKNKTPVPGTFPGTGAQCATGKTESRRGPARSTLAPVPAWPRAPCSSKPSRLLPDPATS